MKIKIIIIMFVGLVYANKNENKIFCYERYSSEIKNNFFEYYTLNNQEFNKENVLIKSIHSTTHLDELVNSRKNYSRSSHIITSRMMNLFDELQQCLLKI